MKLPTWDELKRDSDQVEILEHPLDQPLFVAGPPGSGKTILAVRRAQMLAENGTSATIVTFNRMLRRLTELLDNGKSVASTMHSFAWLDIRKRTGSAPNTYDWDWARILKTVARCSPLPKIDHLIIDEGQDLPAEFFRYAASHAANVITVFADEDQALSDRRTTLEQIRTAAKLPNPRLLQSNHLNAPEVARVAEHFHAGRLPAANVQRKAIGSRPRLVQTLTPNATAELIATWFRNRGGSIGVVVVSNSSGRLIQKLLRERLREARIDRYDHRLKNDESINVNEDGITILNRESVKGQEFDSVFVLELDRLLPWQNETMRRVLYMICSRARDYLTLVYGPAPLSDAADSQLPGPGILERL